MNVTRLTLYRSDIQHEDSGNYTCEVNGPHNALLGAVTHYIYVRGAHTHTHTLSLSLSISISLSCLCRHGVVAHLLIQVLLVRAWTS